MTTSSESTWRHWLAPWADRTGLWKGATVGLMGALWWSSSRSFDPEGVGLPSASMNLLHFVAYAGLAVVAGLGFGAAARRVPPAWRRWIFGALLAWAFGLTDELHQNRVPGRFCSTFDFLVDGLGGAFGVLVAALIWQGEGAWTPRRRALALFLLVVGVFFALVGFRWFPEFDGLFARL